MHFADGTSVISTVSASRAGFPIHVGSHRFDLFEPPLSLFVCVAFTDFTALRFSVRARQGQSEGV